MILDIDYFKSVNDSFGHDIGDSVLIHISNIIAQSIRNSDMLARYGGEEFLIMLPETGLNEAARLAERVRIAIYEDSFEILKGRRLSISCGVATTRENIITIDQLVKIADLNLYNAKKQGRNKTVW